MKRYGWMLIVTGIVLMSFGIGFYAGGFFQPAASEKKPVVSVKPEEPLIDENTQIIFEQHFSKCNHVIISELANYQELLGKRLNEIKQLYTSEKGYSITLKDNVLTIRQQVDDWCPEHKQKCRLKEYRGRVAVYQGPDADHDVLIRVTGIELADLPQEMVKNLQDGKYEFDNEQLLNDALESLDDYL